MLNEQVMIHDVFVWKGGVCGLLYGLEAFCMFTVGMRTQVVL